MCWSASSKRIVRIREVNLCKTLSTTYRIYKIYEDVLFEYLINQLLPLPKEAPEYSPDGEYSGRPHDSIQRHWPSALFTRTSPWKGLQILNYTITLNHKHLLVFSFSRTNDKVDDLARCAPIQAGDGHVR
jgi:hypothetical protein